MLLQGRMPRRTTQQQPARNRSSLVATEKNGIMGVSQNVLSTAEHRLNDGQGLV